MSSQRIAEGPFTLISSAQNFTGSWADLGSEIAVNGFNSIGLWLNIDINDSVNTRVRLIAKHTTAGTNEYSLPLKDASATEVSVVGEYYEFTSDADQKIVLSWDIDNVIPIVQFQIQAGTAGASPGQIDDAVYTIGYK